MEYCTYEFYRDTYGGVAISEGEWKRAEIKARALIDRITFGRLKRVGFNSTDEYPEDIKLAVCAAAEYSLQAERNGGRTIASETTSKHSVTYGDTDSSVESGMMRSAMQFLSGSPWTYRGVYCFERHTHGNCSQCNRR